MNEWLSFEDALLIVVRQRRIILGVFASVVAIATTWILFLTPQYRAAAKTLFATDRTDRVTYIAQGWKVTDPQALAGVGPVPDHETLIEIPEDVLKMYALRYLNGEGQR